MKGGSVCEALQKYREYISARADGELSAAELAELEEHLGSCAVCAAFAARLESTETLLGSLSAKAPAGFAARVSAAAQKREEIRPKSIPLWQSLALKGLGTAAVLCLVLAAALFSGKFDGSEKTGKAPPEGLSSMPTLAPGGNYESSDRQRRSPPTCRCSRQGTLAEIHVCGIVSSETKRRRRILCGKDRGFFPRKAFSEGGDVVIEHYTPPTRLYIRVTRNRFCRYMRLLTTSERHFETDEEAARYPLATRAKDREIICKIAASLKRRRGNSL